MSRDPAAFRFLARLFGGGKGDLYRVACLWEDDPPEDRLLWRHWMKVRGTCDEIAGSLPAAAFLRSVQVDPEAARRDDRKGNFTRFRKLRWTAASDQRWIRDLESRPSMRLGHTEVWAPWRDQLKGRRGPQLYLRIDGPLGLSPDTSLDWQSLTIALRHDVLPSLGSAVERLLYEAAQLMTSPQSIIFDRSWAEYGGYGGAMRVNGLEDSFPAKLGDWLDRHPEARLRRFEEGRK